MCYESEWCKSHWGIVRKWHEVSRVLYHLLVQLMPTLCFLGSRRTTPQLHDSCSYQGFQELKRNKPSFKRESSKYSIASQFPNAPISRINIFILFQSRKITWRRKCSSMWLSSILHINKNESTNATTQSLSPDSYFICSKSFSHFQWLHLYKFPAHFSHLCTGSSSLMSLLKSDAVYQMCT